MAPPLNLHSQFSNYALPYPNPTATVVEIPFTVVEIPLQEGNPAVNPSNTQKDVQSTGAPASIAMNDGAEVILTWASEVHSASRVQIQQYDDELNFSCSAPLGKLYQATIGKVSEEEAKELFTNLEDKHKDVIQSHFGMEFCSFQNINTECLADTLKDTTSSFENLWADKHLFREILKQIIIQQFALHLSAEDQAVVRLAITGHSTTIYSSKHDELKQFGKNIPYLAQVIYGIQNAKK